MVASSIYVNGSRAFPASGRRMRKKNYIGHNKYQVGTRADAKSGEYEAMHERDHLSAMKGASEETNGWPRIRSIWMDRILSPWASVLRFARG